MFFTYVGMITCALLVLLATGHLIGLFWYAMVVTIMEVWLSPEKLSFLHKVKISFYVFYYELKHYVLSAWTIVRVTKNGWIFEPPFKLYRTPKDTMTLDNTENTEQSLTLEKATEGGTEKATVIFDPKTYSFKA